jgi:hypothetical protein
LRACSLFGAPCRRTFSWPGTDGEQVVAENIECVRRYHEEDVARRLDLGDWLVLLGAANRLGRRGS